MSESQDQDWLDALMGKEPVAGAQLSAVKEGAVVRHAMIASHQKQPAFRFDADGGLRRLLARLRQEKLLGEPRGRGIGWRFPALAGAAALVIALIIALQQPQRTAAPGVADIPVLPGGPQAAQIVVTPDAREIAAELAVTLAQAGFTPTVTEIGSITRLEADWPQRPSEKQLEFLRTYKFSRPDGPRLRIEVHVPQQ